MRKKMHSKKWAGLLNKNLSTPAFYKRDFLKQIVVNQRLRK